VAVTRPQLVRELRELIVALDRRVPRVEQAGEASIATDAAALRAKAMKRLEELTDPKTPGAGASNGRSARKLEGKPR
jgi:hypothetical protein